MKTNSEFEIKTDCFAFKGGQCMALTDLYCTKEKCSFYKSKEEYISEQIQNANRY